MVRSNRSKSRLFGVGLNDSISPTQQFEHTYDEKGLRKTKLIFICPFYRKWKQVLERCYSESFQRKHPSYIGCSVCDDWLVFSNFKKWMEKQDWEGKELDKDLLFPGNKLYGPHTCVFLERELNLFITESKSTRGEHPIGVSLFKPNGKFKATIHNPLIRKSEHLGYFDSPELAHIAWLTRKIEFARMYATKQSDKRIAEALISRYESYK